MLFKKLGISLVISISILLNYFNVYAAQLLLGGDSIGIDLDYNGILITGTYDITVNNKAINPKTNGLNEGSIITHVNGKKVANINELMNEIEKRAAVSQKIILTHKKESHIYTSELFLENKDDHFSTGLYVSDGISGIGTLTYYNPKTKRFGALGHMMNDKSLDIELKEVKGSIYESEVTDIVKSYSYKPGEKIADIATVKIGNVDKNNQYGLYGGYDISKVKNKEIIETADINEVKKGKAYFYTVLQGSKIQKCEIEIIEVKKQEKKDIKGITFKVTDKKLLSNSNGIVQGMSGSPIVQNGKLIGCVTHVDIKEPHIGYGLYIEWMLENDN